MRQVLCGGYCASKMDCGVSLFRRLSKTHPLGSVLVEVKQMAEVFLNLLVEFSLIRCRDTATREKAIRGRDVGHGGAD